jgi:hypothetical protein
VAVVGAAALPLEQDRGLVAVLAVAAALEVRGKSAAPVLQDKVIRVERVSLAIPLALLRVAVEAPVQRVQVVHLEAQAAQARHHQ